MTKNKKPVKIGGKKPGGGHLVSTPVFNPQEFEGLLGFEELPPCTIKQVDKHGKKFIKPKKFKKQSTSKTQSTKDQGGKKAPKRKKQQQFLGAEPVLSKKAKYNCATFPGVDQPNEKVDVSEWEMIFVPPPVRDALAELGFSQPTEIQRLVLPAAIKGRKDIIGAAETGSGKTLAFAIPIINGILEDKQREVLESTSDERVDGKEDEEGVKDVEIEEENDKDMGGALKTDEMDESFEVEDDSDDEMMTVPESSDSGSDSQNGYDDIEREKRWNKESKIEEESEIEEDVDGILESDDSASDSQSDDDITDGDSAPDTEGLGCVKVLDDIEFDFLENENTSASKGTKKLRALIVTPTRELAIQVNSHICAVLKYTGLRSAVVVGGVAIQKQERLLRHGPEIVVGTPGRLWELIQSNDHLRQVPQVKYLAIDETDRMVERGHFQELMQLLELINSNQGAREKRQTFVFSATLSTVHDFPKRLKIKQKPVKMTSEGKIEQLAHMIGIKNNRKVVDVTKKFGTAATLTETRINCSMEEKDFYLYYFLKCYPGRTLVFCNSIDCVRRLRSLFTLLQCQPQCIHASMLQKQRLVNLEKFSRNPKGVLLATDVAARGLDIPDIQHVIHYQVPHTAETYIHRSGRTARARKEGLSVLFIESAEVKKYRQLCATLNRSSDLPPFPVDLNIMGQVKQRVRFARTVEKIDHKQQKACIEKDWFRKAAMEAELLDSE